MISRCAVKTRQFNVDSGSGTCPPPNTSFFFFNDTATTEIYTLSLHDALPISTACFSPMRAARCSALLTTLSSVVRSEEHTSEPQSRLHLVCRLLLEKKKNNKPNSLSSPTCPRARCPRMDKRPTCSHATASFGH